MSLEIISSPQPYFIPGYTGFCPQYKYRNGHTYGSTTHKLLLDPTISHAEHHVLSDRTVDDYQVLELPEMIKDLREHAIYEQPMVPGYAGFVPRLNGLHGQTYTISANEAMSTFERQQLANKEALNVLHRHCTIQNNQWEPRNIEDRLLTESEFKLPLLEVRPECVGIVRNIIVDEPPVSPSRDSASQFLMENTDTNKSLKQGYAGHIPFGYAEFGKTHEAMTNSALCNFSSNYRQRRSTEWAPVILNQPDPSLLIHPSVIYQTNTGQIPNYAGHIPGEIFRYGKTYGNDTRDAKRWLRGDYSN